MQTLLNSIEKAIADKYSEIRQSGKSYSGIMELDRQLRFQYPELACHIKKRMLDMAEKQGNLS